MTRGPLGAGPSRSDIIVLPGLNERVMVLSVDTLDAGAPALVPVIPAAVAAASTRLEKLIINPYSWLSELRRWPIRRP